MKQGTKTERETDMKEHQARKLVQGPKWSDIVWCIEDWPGCKKLVDNKKRKIKKEREKEKKLIRTWNWF